MTKKERIGLALRILSARLHNEILAPEDVQALRTLATGAESRMEPEMLASYVIERELR